MGRIPASEIVRSVELSLGRAAALRAEARRLLQEADAADAEARASAIAAMGSVQGAAAYELAAWTFREDVGEPATELSVQPAAAASRPSLVTTHAEEPASTLAATSALSEALNVSVPREPEQVAPAAADRQVPKSVPPKVEMYGIEIPPSRTAEAEEIVQQAKSFLSQGRKSNPHANDRGKNAWRKALFNAAWSAMATEHEASAEAAVSHPGEQTVDPEKATPVPTVVDAPLAKPGVPDAGDLADLDEEESSQSALDEDFEVPNEVLSEIEVPDEDLLDTEVPDEVLSEFELHEEVFPDSEETGFRSDEITAADETELEDDDGFPDRHSGVPEADPLDDLTELPPASNLPPPRGYPEGADVAPSDPVRPSMMRNPFPGPRPVPAASPSVAPAGPQPTVSGAAPGPNPIHTPRPVPPTRRPGNGQVLQKLTTLPPVLGQESAPHPTAAPPKAPRVAAFRAPPSFMKR